MLKLWFFSFKTSNLALKMGMRGSIETFFFISLSNKIDNLWFLACRLINMLRIRIYHWFGCICWIWTCMLQTLIKPSWDGDWMYFFEFDRSAKTNGRFVSAMHLLVYTPSIENYQSNLKEIQKRRYQSIASFLFWGTGY